MKKTKLIPIFTAIFALTLCLAMIGNSQAYAEGSLNVSYGSTNITNYNYFTGTYPVDNGLNAAFGMTFTPSSTGYLTHAGFYLDEFGATAKQSTITAALFTLDSNAETALPTTIIENSTTTYNIDTSAISLFYAGFDFEGTTEIEAGTYYGIAVYMTYTNGTAGSNCLRFGYDASPAYSNGSGIVYSNGWTNPGTIDIPFQVWTNDTPTATPTPTPSPSPAPTVIGGVTYVWNGTDWILPSGNWLDNTYGTDEDSGIAWLNDTVPFIVPLLILFGGGGLGWYLTGRRGFIGFFIGINAAAIICYAVMPAVFPLWAVIALIMVDAVLVFNAVRNNGGGE